MTIRTAHTEKREDAMKKAGIFVLCSLFLFLGTAWATPDGVWKDNPSNPTYNFYVQTYQGDSMIVIVAAGVADFWVFLDSNYKDGFTASQDLNGDPHQIVINFASDDAAVATITFQGSSAASYAISRTVQAPASSSGGSGTGNPPSGVLTAPSGGANLSGTYLIQGTATDDVGVQKVGIKIGSAAEVNAAYNSATNQFTYSWDTTSVADGTTTIQVTVYDTEGLNTVIAAITVTVSNGGGSGGTTVNLVYPPDGSTGLVAPFDLEWDPVSGASSYRIQISNDALFTSLVDDRFWASTFFTVTGLTGGPFYWRVSAIIGGVQQSWSSEWDFSGTGGGGGPVVPPPSGTTVTLLTPANGANVFSPVSMTWTAVSGAIGYHLQICYDSSCSITTYDDTAWPYSGAALPASPGTRWWRVRANLGGGVYGAWTSIWSFVVN